MDGHAKSHADESMMMDDALEAPPIVRFDERRMHIRAYNYWASLLGDRQLPSIEDLNPAEIEDFGSHSVLLDFTSGVDDPAIAFLGSALVAQCDITSPIDRASQIPPRSLLSRLTDHYLQIIANATPIGFEAEFTNQRGNEILYRGIMMPFSADDDSIDFVYGVINWKELANDALTASIVAQVQADGSWPEAQAAPKAGRVWSDFSTGADDSDEDDADGDESDKDLEADAAFPAIAPGGDPAQATLDDCLATAREAAAAATASEGRTRHALYRAIGLAHAFALAARARPAAYDEILAESGLVATPRSPMTALVKLVFGASYDKTRIAEFVCAVDHALAHDLAPGALIEHLKSLPGGLKALIAQTRAARRGETAAATPKSLTRARKALAAALPLAPGKLETDESGLAVVVVRRDADGGLVPVATLDGTDQLVARVITAAARGL